MRLLTKVGTALVSVSALVALSACGNSTAKLLEPSTAKTKNAALDDNSGLNVKAFTFNREQLTGWENSDWGVGLEDQIARDESKLTACPEGTPSSVDVIDNGQLNAIQNACQPEFLVVHYTGFVTVPGNEGEDVTVNFKVAKDDTFFMTVDGTTVVDDWHNSGCQWAEGTATLKAGQKYPLDAWFSQFRGGICNQMTWSVNGGEYEIVPSSALSRVDESVAASTSTTISSELPSSTTEPTKVNEFSVDQSDTMLVEGDETYNPANNKTFNAPAGKKFGEVLWASYGTPTVNNKILTLSNCNSETSLSVVQAAASGKTSFVLPAGNNNYGDPCYGTYKRVKALITLVNDENYVANEMATGVQIDAPNTAYFETAEHYPKEVTAPEGKLFGKVLFASYGIQNLSGNKVSLGWCNSTSSVDLVKEALANKKTGTIPASNGNYGDPCYGTYKYVKVVMSLIDDPSYVKPTSPTTTVEPASIAAPTNVSVTAGNGSATVTWNAPAAGNTEVTGYMVQYSTDGFRNATTISVDSLEALAFGLANGQETEFRVAATNKESGVVSDWSSVVKATPTAPTSTTSTTVAPDETVSNASIKTDGKSITIDGGATVINCDKACFDTIAESLGVTDGAVFVSVDGGERVALDGSKYTKIPVGTSAQKLSFMTVNEDVVNQISLNLKRDGQATTSSSNGGSGSSSSNTMWLLLALLVVILGGGGFAYSRKKN